MWLYYSITVWNCHNYIDVHVLDVVNKILMTFITPRACARGKVIGRVVVIVVVVVIVHKKITRSRDLGTSVTRKYNKFVEVIKKLALGCLESSGMVYKLHK